MSRTHQRPIGDGLSGPVTRGLMLFVFVAGPTLFLLNCISDNIGQYLKSFVPRTFWTAPLANGEWHKKWTLFYWGWWISWAPFVGMFIARISKGRTLREFVMGAMFAPTLATFVWLTVFGDTGLHIELFGGGGIAEAVSRDVSPRSTRFSSTCRPHRSVRSWPPWSSCCSSSRLRTRVRSS